MCNCVVAWVVPSNAMCAWFLVVVAGVVAWVAHRHFVLRLRSHRSAVIVSPNTKIDASYFDMHADGEINVSTVRMKSQPAVNAARSSTPSTGEHSKESTTRMIHLYLSKMWKIQYCNSGRMG